MRKNRARLEKYLASCSGQLDYSKFDCVRFAAGWAALNGRALELPVWASEREALKVVSQYGGRLVYAVSAFLGEPSTTPAPWGSIVSVDNPPLDGVGIADGSEGVFLSPVGGFHRVSLAAAPYHWVF